MQDIWEIGKNIAFGQGLFTLTTMAKQHEGSNGEMGVLVPTLFH